VASRPFLRSHAARASLAQTLLSMYRASESQIVGRDERVRGKVVAKLQGLYFELAAALKRIEAE
jgi:hypothetical protein